MLEPMLVSKREAAEALSISLRKLEHLIAAKEILVRRIGGRVLVPTKSLAEFAGQIQPKQEGSRIPSCQANTLSNARRR